MAASLKSLAGFVKNKGLLNLGTSCGRLYCYGATRSNHILLKDDSESKIVMADNGDTIVCWHPAPKFPYECSLPLPTKSTNVNHVLKTTEKDFQETFHYETPQQQREYLMKMTATTKHRWFPRLGIKYAKKNKPDREFL